MLRLLFWVAVKDHNAVVVGHDRVELLVIVPIGRPPQIAIKGDGGGGDLDGMLLK